MKIAVLARNFGQISSAYRMSATDIMKESGWNLGNMAFWYATRLILDNEAIFIDWSTKASSLPNDVGALVIPAANFLNETADLTNLANLVKELNKPVLLWGIGAQSESEKRFPKLKRGVVDFLKEVSLRTPHICVRGDYSEAVCRHYGIRNIKVLGCPSILIGNDPFLGQKIQQGIENLSVQKVAIHAACVKNTLESVERELIRITLQKPGSNYIIQRPPELISVLHSEPLTDEEAIYIEKCARFFAFDDSEHLAQYIGTYGYVPSGIESWISFLRSYSCAVNTRIHGTIISIMAGIPAICICHDTRTTELAKRLMLPHLTVTRFIQLRYEIREIFKESAFDGSAFDQNRAETAAAYRDMINEAGLSPSQHLLSLSGAS